MGKLTTTLGLGGFLTHILLYSSVALGSYYEDLKSKMAQLVKQYPQRVRLFTLGVSDLGEPIQGLAVGDGALKNLVVATHHGNEYGSTEVAFSLAKSVAARLISGQTVFVIPVLNVSGYNARRREEKAGNRWFDSNRDYPGPCNPQSSHQLKSTAALARFLETEQISLAATLHTYYPAVVYPWGITQDTIPTLYEAIFRQLAQAATSESHYPIGNASEVVYPAMGTFEDFAYWKYGVWSLLFELGNSHSPSPEKINEMIQINVPGLRKMLEESPSSRAESHEFPGHCDPDVFLLDRHEE